MRFEERVAFGGTKENGAETNVWLVCQVINLLFAQHDICYCREMISFYLNNHGLLVKKSVYLMLLLNVALVTGNEDRVVLLQFFICFDVLLSIFGGL